ncbi:MAG: DUF4071 domain-containing protein [Chloroflexi bacterium]|nr:DUF4071 domain-containing protein [Chloroflexota bacterium]
MNSSDYTPEPLDTSGIELPKPLLELEERLAQNTHEVWAKHRMAEGWTLGPRRDDERKQHPCLVPYDQLPESEKAYDRVLAHNTLAAVVALGYHIEPPAHTPAAPDSAASQDLILLQLREALDLAALLAIWQGRIVEQWQYAPGAYRLLAERLLGLGEPLLAYDVVSEGRQHSPTDWRLRQLEALALARSGATGRASELLQELRAEGATDEETLGMLGRTEKDFGLSAADADTRRNHLAQAARLYEESFQRHQGYWSGINAATLYLLDGEVQQANSLARAVREQCLGLVREAPDNQDYWVLATLGEAALVLGDHAEASRWYTAAVQTGRGRLGDIASTRRNARLLLEYLGSDPARIENTLHIPSVALFKGAGTSGQGESALHDTFEAQLTQADCRLGYACITGPAETVFLETILERGGTPYVVTPYDADAYLADLSGAGLQGSWLERAKSVVAQAGRLIVASPGGAAQSIAGQQFAHLLVAGLAAADARRLDTELVSLDGVAPQPPAPQAERFPSQIVGMLFADAVHFSRLREAEVVIFSDLFMGAIGQLVASSANAPVFTNTWGDGLFFVFRNVVDAGTFALSLRDLVNTTDWVARGLPAELNLRIGLHAGPVFGSRDPITGRAGYFGTHISRAARIEPITPPGHVYASEPFAALSELVSNRIFTCEYVGQTPQAKGYGTFPTYHVRPFSSPD